MVGNKKLFLLVLLVAVVTSFLTAHFMQPSSGGGTEKQAHESAYERVMRTGILRCGYINYPPHFIIDPNTSKKSGIMHDIIEEAARLLKIKVEWVEELGWGNTVTAIQSHRIDAVCTSFWQNPVEGKYLSFSMPLFYSGVTPYVQSDDDRFADLSLLNDPAISISATDGNMAFLIAQQDYPKAKILSLPNMSEETNQLLNVAMGKADVTFIETYLGEEYRQNNPNKLKPLFLSHPIRLFGNTVALPLNDVPLKSMLDSAFVQMLYGGSIDRIIKKYEEVPNAIFRVAKPYQ
jgi:ABC-type amino acid transport substrate-binding protein